MTDLSEKIQRAAERVDVEWSEARLQRVERSMLVRRRRRAQTKTALGVTAALLVVVFGGLTIKRIAGSHTQVAVAPPASAAPEPLRFSDGSVASPLDASSVVESKEVTASKIDVELVKGSAHFEVSKNPQRVFRVEAGKVSVEVLGTGFTVERTSDGGAKVNVDHGRVRVDWGAGNTILVDGQGSTFPPPPAATSTTAEAPTEPAPSASTTASASSAPLVTWKTLAHDADFDKAYAAMKLEGPVHDDVGELQLAADVARLSHHPSEAVPYLRKIVDQHAGDPRASLAAFTLGRVFLEELGQPAEAANAFAKARALGGGSSSLAEDALAREVEAWSRAGMTDQAHAKAEEYVKLYPNGLRIKSVKKYGGLEE